MRRHSRSVKRYGPPMTPPSHSRQVHLVRRPHGEPALEDFEVVEVEVPDPADGEVVVANRYLSVDPYMRGRMRDTKSYVPPFELDQPMDGGAVGEVIASASDDVAVGDHVVHHLGWREVAVVPADRVRPVAGADVPLSANLGVLGMTGLTAYVGLFHIAGMTAGDRVFVSGAAGAVGSVAGQMAQIKGASQVIGSAGSPDKVAFLTETLGFDAAFDYHDGPVAGSLAAAAPEGIDVYFDNVGGDHLQAAIGALRPHGRVALCGAISGYNATAPSPGPNNLALAIGKRLTLRGFIVSDHDDLRPRFLEDAGAWLAHGRLRHDETVVDGIEHAPQAFINLLAGGNTGKMVVRT